MVVRANLQRRLRCNGRMENTSWGSTLVFPTLGELGQHQCGDHRVACLQHRPFEGGNVLAHVFSEFSVSIEAWFAMVVVHYASPTDGQRIHVLDGCLQCTELR
mmetsp:Transcript_80141/g.154930  ORF Transcript_80141/g.154930 Transcript_80141/m.154930 type:complete len:103 (+) Transcript_80141:72-380(+)